LTWMSHPSLWNEGHIKEDSCNCTAGNKKRLETFGADMWDVSKGRIALAVPIWELNTHSTYGIVNPSVIVEYMGFPSAAQLESMATSMAEICEQRTIIIRSLCLT
jgi:hypothetical protein